MLIIFIILIRLYNLLPQCRGNEIEAKVLLLQRSGTFSAGSFASLQTPFPRLNDFTLCYRIKISRYRVDSTLMNYVISENRDYVLSVAHRESGTKVLIHGNWVGLNDTTPLQKWTHYCITFIANSGNWEIFQNGEKELNSSFQKKFGSIEGGGAYTIGQKQDFLEGSFNSEKSYSDELTDLNIWSKKLTSEEILKVASCDSVLDGDALSWSESEWKVEGEAKWTFLNRSELCHYDEQNIVIFPIRLTLQESINFCEVLGGRVAVPKNDVENQFVYENSVDYANYCSNKFGRSYLWLGASDEEIESKWMYLGTSTPIGWTGPWSGDGPNGGTGENCIVMLYGTVAAEWSDIACLSSYYFCVPCEFEEKVWTHLRGPAICETSPFDRNYFLDKPVNGKPSLTGSIHSEIYWENETSSWVLKSLEEENSLLRYIPDKSDEYPFGSHTWQVESEVCSYSEGDLINMTLSSCNQDEFTCKNGECIKLDVRCNLKVDCKDESDEDDCKLISFPEDYGNTMSPSSIDPRKPLSIGFILTILSFSSITTTSQSFQTSVDLHLKWRDSRLTYKNLKSDRSLNLLSQTEASSIWTPKVFFSNANNNLFTNLDEGSKIECISHGNSVPSSVETEEEANIFSGEETSLEMSQYYAPTYSCDFHLLMFPFDAQICSMDFVLTSASSGYMTMQPIIAQYTGSKNLLEYTIADLQMNNSIFENHSIVSIKVRFLRRYGFYILTLYMPSVLLVIIAYGSLFYNPLDFNSRVLVALTSLQVLHSLFTQTSTSLPKTSHFKLIDIWLFFSTFIIFVIIIFETFAEYYSFPSHFAQRKKRQELKATFPLNKWLTPIDDDKTYCFGIPLHMYFLYAGRIVAPIIYIVFNMIYWGITYQYLKNNVWLYELSPLSVKGETSGKF